MPKLWKQSFYNKHHNLFIIDNLYIYLIDIYWYIFLIIHTTTMACQLAALSKNIFTC